MRALILAAILGVFSATALAQPTTTKPDEASPVTKTGAATIKVTTKRFGSIKPGKKLTLAVLKKTFAKAAIAKAKGGGWTIENKTTGLVGTADATQILITAGPVEVHGVTIGSDGSALAGDSFAGTFCFVEKSGEARVSCDKDALALRLGECRAQPQGDGIPLTSLAGCKVEAITWIAYAPPK